MEINKIGYSLFLLAISLSSTYTVASEFDKDPRTTSNQKVGGQLSPSLSHLKIKLNNGYTIERRVNEYVEVRNPQGGSFQGTKEITLERCTIHKGMTDQEILNSLRSISNIQSVEKIEADSNP